jgi:hypothetical protein
VKLSAQSRRGSRSCPGELGWPEAGSHTHCNLLAFEELVDIGNYIHTTAKVHFEERDGG